MAYFRALLTASLLFTTTFAAATSSQQFQCPTNPALSKLACNPSADSPVCVTYDNSTTKDFQNPCFACAADKANINYYTNGSCSLQQQQCPTVRLGVSSYACNSQDNSPVCVTYKNATTKTFQNSCYGCATSRADINYFGQGACPLPQQQCPPTYIISQMTCSPLNISPVCVKYNNGTRSTSLNFCYGCTTNRADVNYFTTGACL